MHLRTKGKKLEKILICICTILMLFNFIFPIRVSADGGTLVEPIRKFISFSGDSILWILQYAFLGENRDIVTQVEKGDTIEISDVGWFIFPFGTAINAMASVYNLFQTNTVEVPRIMISPEKIFANEIPAFDINFFSPSNDGKEISSTSYRTISIGTVKEFAQALADGYINFNMEKGDEYKAKVIEIITPIVKNDNTHMLSISSVAANELANRWSEEKLGQYILNNSSEGKKATGFGNVNVKTGTIVEREERESSAKILQPIVSYWYNLFRNISVIGLLSVLVYIGIKIVTSTIASQKAKYQELLKDWLIALCLVFFMHYFMNFIITVTGSISNAIIDDTSNSILQKVVLQTEDGNVEMGYIGDKLIGNARIQLQSAHFSQRVSYTIVYAVLVIYTVIFAVIYLKRVIYMAFFTMIAPLVALTYPLDKIRDGKAQAFEFWIKEYTFNALIQPMHLILYYIIVGSSLEIALNNPIYALVAIGFLMPAEKIMRKFFGFDKASTTGFLGGALSGAVAMQGINSLRSALGGAKGKGEKDKNENELPIRTADSGLNTGSLMSDIAEGNPENTDIGGSGENINARQQQNNNSGRGGFEVFPSEEMEDYYNDSNADFEDNQSIQEKMKEIEESDYNYQYNPEWIALNERLNGVKPRKASSQTSKASLSIPIPKQNGNLDSEEKDDYFDEEEYRKKRAKAGAIIGVRMLGKGLKFGGKALLKGYGAATLGTVGIAAGLASEKYSNAFTWGLGGAAAGKMLADSGMNFVGSTLPSTAYRIKHEYEDIRDEVEKEVYTSSERKIIANERADDAFRTNSVTRSLYKHAFGANEYKQAMEDAIKYREYGITDDDVIIRAMKLKSRGLSRTDRADKNRILVAKTATQLSRKDLDKFGERLRFNRFTEEQSENILQAIREFNDWE